MVVAHLQQGARHWNEPVTYLTEGCKSNHYILNNTHHFSCFTYLSRKLFRTEGRSEALQAISDTDWKLAFLNYDDFHHYITSSV
jgi:hypothetical protein